MLCSQICFDQTHQLQKHSTIHFEITADIVAIQHLINDLRESRIPWDVIGKAVIICHRIRSPTFTGCLSRTYQDITM